MTVSRPEKGKIYHVKRHCEGQLSLLSFFVNLSSTLSLQRANVVQKYDQGFRFQRVFTSMWLGRVLTNLNPGILLSLHTTPTSSVCLQSDTPIPLEGHRAKVLSLPLQWRLSNQMGPDKTGQKRNPSVLPLGGIFPL